MMTDPIADMLTRIRNAHLALHKEVSVPSSKMKEAIAAILKQEGYVDDVTVEDRNINIQLKYFKGKPAIEGPARHYRAQAREHARSPGVCGRAPDPQGAERPRHLHPVHFARGARWRQGSPDEGGRRTFV